MSNPILIVEDNDDLSVLFRLVLESAGYQVATVDNGYDALEYVEKTKPLLVLMDIMMPEISGLQVSRNIKQQQNFQSLPILLVSAIDRLKDEQLHDSKANDILYKPFNLDDLVFKVDRLIETNSESNYLNSKTITSPKAVEALG